MFSFAERLSSLQTFELTSMYTTSVHATSELSLLQSPKKYFLGKIINENIELFRYYPLAVKPRPKSP